MDLSSFFDTEIFGGFPGACKFITFLALYIICSTTKKIIKNWITGIVVTSEYVKECKTHYHRF
jgi:hypothetical protein